MHLKESKPGCCIDYEPLPEDIQCLAPYICKEFSRLHRLHRRAFVKSRRILELAKAKPRARAHRFVRRCPCFFKKDIQIVRLDQRENTRTEQLAFPRARYLLLLKQKIRNLFPPDRIVNINRLIRKSLFSVYTRLGNVQPPTERKPIPKWDRAEWDRHTKILRKLAKHKVVKKPPETPSKKMALSSMKRYKMLAKPKISKMIQRAEWELTQAMRDYKASPRLSTLARPVIRDTSGLHRELPIKIPQRVLKHKASERLTALSKPNVHKSQSAPSDLKENPFAISPSALKAKASKRIRELAEPREYENVHIREDPYAISKAALNAKARPRTIALAKPKKTS